MTDIEIASSCKMKPIKDVAKSIDIENKIENYGNFAIPNGFHSVYDYDVVFSMRSLCASTVFILFIAVSVFRVAHRATALHSDKAVENSFS